MIWLIPKFYGIRDMSSTCEINHSENIRMLASPKSLDEEHKELMNSFRECSKRKDETGKAISQLLEVLEPHFEKEQRVVMPLLGSVSDLVSGEKISNLNEIASAQAPLLEEYEVMFEEHKAVRELIAKAEKAATREGSNEVVELLKGLAHHASIEEEVLYPSALLAGTLAKCLQPQERKGGGIA
jgi:iron-sulfur cluster repair protein YtfE (RIC family)